MKNLSPRQFESLNLIKVSFLELLGKINYESITISRICTKATVSRSTFYRFFDTKEELLDSIIAEKLLLTQLRYDEKFFDAINPLAPDDPGLHAALLQYYEYWHEELSFLKVIYKQGMFQRFMELYAIQFDNSSFHRLTETLNFSEDEKYYFNALYTSALSSILLTWARSSFKQSPEELARMSLKMFKTLSRGFPV